MEHHSGMPVKWNHDADAVLAQARQQGRPAFLDFSAAPM